MPVAPNIDAINEFSRFLIRQWEREGHHAYELASLLGIKGPSLSTVKYGKNNFSFESLWNLATVAYKWTFSDFLERADVWDRAGRPEMTIVYPERYPNRLDAARFARANGIDEEAIAAVLSENLLSENDQTPLEWFESMREEHRRRKRRALDPVQTQKRDTEQEKRNVQLPHDDRPSMPIKKPKN